MWTVKLEKTPKLPLESKANLRIPSVIFGAALLLLGLDSVPAEAGNASLTPLTCVPAIGEMQPVAVPQDGALFVCSKADGGPEVIVVTDPDTSWPVLLEDDEARSLRDYLLSTMHAFGAGLLYFNNEDDGVWIVSDGAGSSGYMISLTGNDPLTLEKKRAFLVVPTDSSHGPSLHLSLGEALDQLLAL